MGLLDNLFKARPKTIEEKIAESGIEARLAKSAAATPAEGGAAPDPSAFLHPREFVPHGSQKKLEPLRSANHGPHKADEKRTAPSVAVADEIVITVGDVLSRIPTQLLKPGLLDARRELHFKIGDLSPDLARGRAAVPLSRIAQLCPDIFARGVRADEDLEVRLPLQKLVEQIGLLRERAKSPVPKEESALENLPSAPPAPALDEIEIPTATKDEPTSPPAPPAAEESPAPPVESSAPVQVTPPPIIEPQPDVALPPAPHIQPAPFVEQTPLPVPAVRALTPPPLYIPPAAAAPVSTFQMPPPAPAPAPVESRDANAKIELVEAAPPAEPPALFAKPTTGFVPPVHVRPVAVQPPRIFSSQIAAEKAATDEQAARESASRLEPAPIAPPLPPFDQQALQTIFLTEKPLDFRAVSELTAALPGIQACVITAHGETASAGEFPAGYDVENVCTTAGALTEFTRMAVANLPLGLLENFSVFGDQHAVSFFEREGAWMFVLHRSRSFVPGVREKLAAAMIAIAGKKPSS